MGPVSVLALLLDAAWDADRREPPDYESRNRLLMLAMGAAQMEGVPCGLRIDPSEPEWPVVYFELPEPSGQVSFHLPQHERPWDGHDKAEAHARIARYVAESTNARFVVGPDGVAYGPFEVMGQPHFAALDAAQTANRLVDELEQPELPQDPTGVDCAERYEGTEREPRGDELLWD